MDTDDLGMIWQKDQEQLKTKITIDRKDIEVLTLLSASKIISKLRRPKRIFILIGVPYLMVLFLVGTIALLAKAVFICTGFFTIAILMTILIISYIRQLRTINQIDRAQDIVSVQRKIHRLKISCANDARLSVLQIPLWTICWMSWDALIGDPWFYGGIHLLIFSLFAFLAYWLYQQIRLENVKSPIGSIIFSGQEWDPLLKSQRILEQLRSYDN